MIKSTGIFFCILLLSILSPVIIHSEDNPHSAYGSLFIKEGSFAKQTTTFFGFKGGWVIESKYVVGFQFYRLLNPFSTGLIDTVSRTSPRVDFSTGGIYFEYILQPKSYIHGSLSMYCGGGGMSYIPANTNIPYIYYRSINLLVWEPEINLECNIFDWLHLGIGAGYRYITSTTGYYNIRYEDLSGFTGNLTIKLGIY